MNAEFLKQKFAQALDYQGHIATGNPAQQERWRKVDAAAKLTADQASLIKSFTRQMHALVVSGVWCGDCVEQVPILQRIVEANPARIAMKIVDRDQHADLSGMLRINGGARVPVVLVLAEDFELCAILGDRTLSRYRAMVAKKIGNACVIGGAVLPEEELAATTADWVAEFERVQLMLRLSPRLRQQHGD